MVVAGQLRITMDTIAIPHTCSNAVRIVTMSISVSTYYPQHSKAGPVALLDVADRGLHRAKNKGRNHIKLQPLSSEASKASKPLHRLS